MKYNENWLIELNEIKIIEESMMVVYFSYNYSSGSFMTKKIKSHIREFLFKNITISRNSDISDIEKLNDKELLEIYIVIGKYIINNMKNGFYNKYLK